MIRALGAILILLKLFTRNFIFGARANNISPGWSKSCNRNKISTRAEIRHVIRPLLGRITISQTKQITTSTDAQGKDEHDELTTTVWRFTELVAELGLQWRSMKIDVSRFELKGDKEEIETYLAKLT